MYKHDVCLVNDLKKGRDNREYYVLIPNSDNTLKIDIHIDLAHKSIRKLISKDYALELIKKMSKIDIIDVDNKVLENEYKKLLLDGSHDSLIKIIKTTYLRNKERIDSKRKVSDKDDYYSYDITNIIKEYKEHLSLDNPNNIFFTTSSLRDYHYTKQKNNAYYHIQAINLPFQNMEFYYLDKELKK